MQTESKRVFVPNLPEDFTEEEVRHRFFKYGDITSVEIKYRKEVNARNYSHQYAFVNIDTNHQLLQQCFEEFTNKKWKGHWVEVQLAKESFLERLKKEREENQNNVKQTTGHSKTTEFKSIDENVNGKRIILDDEIIAETISSKKKVKKDVKISEKPAAKAKPVHSSSDSDSSSDEDVKVKKVVEQVPLDYIVKNNKNKPINNKIEGVGLAPIHVQINEKPKRKSKDPHREMADQKRLNSMVTMRQGYMQQKYLIKNALLNIDNKQNSKITFNDEDVADTENSNINYEQMDERSKKLKLFDGDDDTGTMLDQTSFKLREEYEGQKGKKLFEMQQRFNQDERFKLDARFVEDDGYDEENTQSYADQPIDEHSMQMHVLGEVLKKPMLQNADRGPRKSMLRFDPNQPEHSKYEIEGKKEKASKRKDDKAAEEEVKLPEVSAETFYEVSEKIPFQENGEGEGFSLLKAFGRDHEEEAQINEDEGAAQEESTGGTSADKKKRKMTKGLENVFKYDSSDDEEETKAENGHDTMQGVQENWQKPVRTNRESLWSDKFFFKKDDYRLQEGVDFVKRMHLTEDDRNFAQVRQELKQLVRRKLATFQKKSHPKKGGHKKLSSSAYKMKKRVHKAHTRRA